MSGGHSAVKCCSISLFYKDENCPIYVQRCCWLKLFASVFSKASTMNPSKQLMLNLHQFALRFVIKLDYCRLFGELLFAGFIWCSSFWCYSCCLWVWRIKFGISFKSYWTFIIREISSVCILFLLIYFLFSMALSY